MRKSLIKKASFIIQALLLMVAPVAAAYGEDQSFSEAQIKAIYLLRFQEYVLSATKEKPHHLCIVGDDLVGSSVTFLIRREAQEDKISVSRKTLMSDFGTCDIVFISRNSENILEQLLYTLNGKDILTVSDHEHFIDKGGMVGFVSRLNKIKLEINMQSVERTNLKVSSKLLQLSLRIID